MLLPGGYRCALIIGCVVIPAYSQEAREPLNAVRTMAPLAIAEADRYVEWNRHFAALSPDQLESLLGDADDSVAVRAAWELYFIRPSLAGPRIGRGAHIVSDIGCARFVAFCERRLRVKLPSWFEPLLRKGIVGSEVRDLTVSPNQALVPRTLVPNRVYTYHEAESLRAEGGNLLLVGEAGALVVPIADLERMGESQIAFASTLDRVWIAEYPRMLIPFSLSLRTNTNVIKWKATVWSQWCILNRSGEWEHRAEVLRHHGAVTIIGVGYEGAYIESFDAMNGRPLLRFMATVVDDGDW